MALNWLPTVRNAGVERRLARGQVLFRLGDPTAGLYQVVRGTVRLVRVDSSGREAILYIAKAGETFAEASLFSPVYRCDAIAATRCTVEFYAKSAVLAVLRSDHHAAEGFMATLAHQVMSLRAGLQLRGVRSARARVRDFLALNAGADGCTVELSGTAKDMAAELGLTHEALYRALARMSARGEISRGKRTIKILKSRR